MNSLDKQEVEEDEESFSEAINLSLGLVLPMAMHTVVQLGVFEIIAKAGPEAKLSATDIASHMPTCKNSNGHVMLERLLRLLASHRILESSLTGTERVYGLTPVAKYYVPDGNGVSLVPFIDIVHYKSFMPSWFELKDAILEGGIPFSRHSGMQIFEYFKIDSMCGQVFNKSMECYTTIVMKKMLEVYKGFEGIQKLVDVGGGLGTTLSLVTSKYPHIKGINLDLPSVIKHAPNYPGVEHIEGDFFQSVPQGDAIFMKWILHDWEDEDCLKILKNCYKAIPENGKVIIVDAVILDTDTSIAAKIIFSSDVLMMLQTVRGKERTREEFVSLATKAGFNDVKFPCFFRNFWVIEFYK